MVTRRCSCWWTRWVCRRSAEHPDHWETRCRRCGALMCFSSDPVPGWRIKVEEAGTW